MAFGDIGGAVTELVITCQTVAEGPVDIKKGDALFLCGPYTVDNRFAYPRSQRIYGQALASADRNGQAIPVKVRGVAIFRCGTFPKDWKVTGVHGVLGSSIEPGFVQRQLVRFDPCGTGVLLKIDEVNRQVHVLL